MKSILSLLALVAIAHSVVGQETADTLQSRQLGEVVIQAPKVIRKADMDLYIPSQSAVSNSKNGIQLLTNLMIPSLSVSDALGTVTSGGQSVQLRINGRESSIEQVRALLPESVKRVEWMENPGLRYGGANTVLNFIVANPEVGGSLMTRAQPALNTAFGFYMADAKVNVGRSQFELGGNFKLTNHINSYRDYSETFRFPDGSVVERNETSLGGNLSNSFGRLAASYSYIRPDTTVIMVDVYASHKFNDRFVYHGLMTRSDDASELLLDDTHGDMGTNPTISAYLEQHFARKQTLVVDLVGSYYTGRSFSDYVETPVGAYTPVSDIHTLIHDRNQAYSLEADYIKRWKNSKLTAGASYTAHRNRSTYDNLGGSVYHQRQDKVYFFGEYFHRLGKLTLTAGLGVQYADFKFRETDLGNSSWNFRPQAAASYSFNQSHQLRLNFSSWQSTPSLSETNPTAQQIDGFQWSIGNPSLRTSNSYMLTLRYSFNIPRVYAQIGARGFISPNAITPLLRWDDTDRLVTTYENSDGLSNLAFFLAPQIEVVPGWVTLSGYLQWRADRMRGTGYGLSHYGWSGNAQLQVSHWGFVLSGMYTRAERTLYGESISWGEDINMVELSYNWKRWQFSAGVIMPFGKYDQGARSLSYWNTNQQHMRLGMRVPYIGVSYNLQWGRQRRDAQKLINSDAKTDASSAGGR